MENILVPVIGMATFFIASFGIIKAIRAKNKEPVSFFGRDGLISLWITTLIFSIIAFIGWFSAPNIKYDIIKNISFILLFLASILTIQYGKKMQKKK
jgi:hypothetical protein